MNLNADVLPGDLITPKEAVVLKLLCEGDVRKTIASKLSRSLCTVNRHVESLERKLDASRAHGVVASAVARGFVRISVRVGCAFLCVCLCSQFDVQPVRLSRVRVGSSRTSLRRVC